MLTNEITYLVRIMMMHNATFDLALPGGIRVVQDSPDTFAIINGTTGEREQYTLGCGS